jgi:hypothetical protein
MFRFRHPDWLSRVDRETLDQAQAEAEAPYSAQGQLVFDGWFPSETVAIQAVLTVLERGIEILTRYQSSKTPETVVDTAEDLCGQIVIRDHRYRPQQGSQSLQTFASAVSVERDKQDVCQPV